MNEITSCHKIENDWIFNFWCRWELVKAQKNKLVAVAVLFACFMENGVAYLRCLQKNSVWFSFT